MSHSVKHYNAAIVCQEQRYKKLNVKKQQLTHLNRLCLSVIYRRLFTLTAFKVKSFHWLTTYSDNKAKNNERNAVTPRNTFIFRVCPQFGIL